MFNKEEIENRIKELQNALGQQQQLVQQVNNNILMIHGAIEEHKLGLKKLEEKEKMEAEAKAKADAEANGAVQDDCVNDEVKDG